MYWPNNANFPYPSSVTQDTHPPCRRPLDASHQKCQKMNGDVTADSESPLLQNILTKLRPFQREAYEFATKSNRQHRGRLLLADEMGLGKTVTSLAIMCAFLQEWPLLVMCPASLRYTWPAEIEKFLPSLPTSAIYVVSGFDDSDFYSNPHKRNPHKNYRGDIFPASEQVSGARCVGSIQFSMHNCGRITQLEGEELTTV